MTEKSKRLKQLLKVIEDNEKNLTDTERMNYQNLKILHIGMQNYADMGLWMECIAEESVYRSPRVFR